MQLSERADHGEEGLSRSRLPGKEHPLGHLSAGQLESFDPAQDADQRLRVVHEVGLPAVVVEAQSDLRVIRRHNVRAGTRHEPHEHTELHDESEAVEDQRNQ